MRNSQVVIDIDSTAFEFLPTPRSFIDHEITDEENENDMTTSITTTTTTASKKKENADMIDMTISKSIPIVRHDESKVIRIGEDEVIEDSDIELEEIDAALYRGSTTITNTIDTKTNNTSVIIRGVEEEIHNPDKIRRVINESSDDKDKLCNGTSSASASASTSDRIKNRRGTNTGVSISSMTNLKPRIGLSKRSRIRSLHSYLNPSPGPGPGPGSSTTSSSNRLK